MHRAQEFGDLGGMFADSGEQIARNLPGQRERRIGVFTQLPGQTADGRITAQQIPSPCSAQGGARTGADGATLSTGANRRASLTFSIVNARSRTNFFDGKLSCLER